LTTSERKKELVAEIEALADDWFRRCMPEIDRSASCFYWAVLTHTKLKEKGFRSLVCGGTATWPRIDLKMDDGKIDTHFTYLFEPDSRQTKKRLKRDRLPEMHMWVQLPDEQEIVDLTTRYLKVQCERRGRLKWLAADPPAYLWCRLEELPQGVHYDPSAAAIPIIRKLIYETWGV
jgi:hypothetical protein